MIRDFIIAINQATSSLIRKFEPCLIMAGPSTGRVLTKVEQMTMLNEVLDDETLSNYSSDDDSASDYDFILYTAIRQFSHRLDDSQKDISWSVFTPRKRRQDLTEDVWCAQKRARGKNLSIGL
jgi:formylmethanofuran dehydrogenase subunit E-like metal-binding protein